MAYNLSFQTKYKYDTTKIGITVPVELTFGPNTVQVDAKLDTGANFCIFERAYADILGLGPDDGERTVVSTANSRFVVFGHWLTMRALRLRFDVTVYFASDAAIRRNVLGRRGFIDQLRLGLVEHNGDLYLSMFDDE